MESFRRILRGRRRSVRAPRFIERVDDRGAAKYFHGRTRELAIFESLCHSAMNTGGGAVFVILGPPGAGKTALLHECARQSQQWDRRAVRIRHDALWDSDSLHNSFRRPRWYTRLEEGGFAGPGGWGISGRLRKMSAPDLLQYHIRKSKQCVLLILDEAQTLVRAQQSPVEHTSAVKMLDDIHNGKMDEPVVLLAAGLGHTLEGLERLELSRSGIDDTINLACLDPESTKSVISDWLGKECGAKGDVAYWVDMIAQQSDGWPQHISAYVQRAFKQLKDDKGCLTDDGLARVLQKGYQDKMTFYNSRLGQKVGSRERQLLGLLIACCDWNAEWTKKELESVFPALKQALTYSTEDTVDRMIRREVIGGNGRGGYGIPIPSMDRFLVGHALELNRENSAWLRELVIEVVSALKETKYSLSPERERLILSDRQGDLLAAMTSGRSLPNTP